MRPAPPRPTAVAVMAKAPRAGRVKTRLCPPLSPGEAARLYRAFLLDRIDQVRALAPATPAVAYAPPEAGPLFEAMAPGLLLLAQEGADLGARLAHTFARLFEIGYGAAILTDSDTPSLPTDYLRRGIALLGAEDADVVLGPTEDGGYYLIGLRALHPGLFEGIPWSTARVFAETVERAEAAGLRTASLPAWFDVDTFDDLRRLERALAEADTPPARHTRRFLAERGGRRPGAVGPDVRTGGQTDG